MNRSKFSRQFGISRETLYRYLRTDTDICRAARYSRSLPEARTI
ncbi:MULTISPECIES: helix-turn-helix domain-containing protein [unclassified Pseudomonas]